MDQDRYLQNWMQPAKLLLPLNNKNYIKLRIRKENIYSQNEMGNIIANFVMLTYNYKINT